MRGRAILGAALVSLILLSFTFPLFTAVAGASDDKVRVIVIFKDKTKPELVRQYSERVIHQYRLIPAIAVSVPNNAIPSLKSNPDIERVERDYELNITADSLPWGVDRINAEYVWSGVDGGTDVVRGRDDGSGVNISIIDTGIDYRHPDLAPNYRGGYDFVNDDDDPLDDNGHGTHCAGIIAAADNDNGIVGVAPGANLYAIKAMDSEGRGYVSDVIAGIEWSVKHKMDIISMSIGSTVDSRALREACDRAYKAGVLLVASSGNRGTGTVTYPGRYDSVIAVAAVDRTDKRASFSGTGPEVELAAPGVKIYSTYIGNKYAVMSGTSMACPHVTGTAALIMHAYPDYTNEQVRELLHATAEDLGPEGKDDKFGYGMVNAKEAAYVNTNDTTPPASVSNLEASATGDTYIKWEWSNPPDNDFSHTMIFLNGTWVGNTTECYYYAQGLTPDTNYTLGTHTVDINGNVNTTWVNSTAKTMREIKVTTAVPSTAPSRAIIPRVTPVLPVMPSTIPSAVKVPSFKSFTGYNRYYTGYKVPSIIGKIPKTYTKVGTYRTPKAITGINAYPVTPRVKLINPVIPEYEKKADTDKKRYSLRPQEWHKR